MFHKNNLFALLVGCSAIGIQAADDAVYTEDFNYQKHALRARAIAQKNIDLAVKLPEDPEKRAAEIKRLDDKFDGCLHNNHHMSSATKIKEFSFKRIVLMHKDEVIGIADGFIRADCEERYPNKGYIETMFVAHEHKQQYPALMKAIIDKINHAIHIRGEWVKGKWVETETDSPEWINLSDKNGYIITDVAGHDTYGQQVCRDLGFTQLEPTEREKEEGCITFELIKPFN